jgi:hypothetical protein
MAIPGSSIPTDLHGARQVHPAFSDVPIRHAKLTSALMTGPSAGCSGVSGIDPGLARKSNYTILYHVHKKINTILVLSTHTILRLLKSLHYTILCTILILYTILYCNYTIVLYYTLIMLCYTILHYTSHYTNSYTMLHYIILYYNILYYTIPY